MPVGAYSVSAFFEGVITEPGGDESDARFAGFDNGNIAFDGAVQVKDFRFTGTGAVQLAVRDAGGAPVRDALVSLLARGGQLGQGFEAPVSQCFGSTNAAGEVTLSSENFSCFAQGGGEFPIFGVTAGPCEVTVFDAPGNLLTTLGPEDGCIINQSGEMVVLEIEVPPPD